MEIEEIYDIDDQEKICIVFWNAVLCICFMETMIIKNRLLLICGTVGMSCLGSTITFLMNVEYIFKRFALPLAQKMFITYAETAVNLGRYLPTQKCSSSSNANQKSRMTYEN